MIPINPKVINTRPIKPTPQTQRIYKFRVDGFKDYGFKVYGHRVHELGFMVYGFHFMGLGFIGYGVNNLINFNQRYFVKQNKQTQMRLKGPDL